MKEYFDLQISDLQNAVKWAAPFVKEALSIYEKYLPNDFRPREAIMGAIEFSEKGKRTNKLRKLAMDGYKASREAKDVSASYAANAASLLAAMAYTHPFRDSNQGKHILGPIIYAALAIEVETNDERNASLIIEKAILNANRELTSLLNEYPRQENRDKKVDRLYYYLDSGMMRDEQGTK